MISMSIHKMKDGRWYASFRYTDSFGKRHQKKKEGFTTKRAAKEWEYDYSSKISNNLVGMSFEVLSEHFLSDARLRMKATSIKMREFYTKNWLVPRWGDIAVNDITICAVRDWQNELIMSRGIKTSTKKIIYHIFRRILNYAVQFFGLKQNPAALLPFTPPPDPDVEDDDIKSHIWTTQQFNTFLRHIDNPTLQMALELLYWTGMRRGELAGLRFADVEGDIIHIRLQQTAIGKSTLKSKTSKRDIQLPAPIAVKLHAYMTHIYKPNPNDRIFFGHPNNLTRDFGAIQKKLDLGLPHIRLHDLRHSHASLLIDMGFSAQAVADRLGHANITMVIKVYGHLFPARRSEIADKLTNLLEKSC